MKTISAVAVVFFVLPLWLNAQPLPSEAQTREWTENRTDGMTLSYSDKYIDYKIDGRIVFRTIERTVTIGSKTDQHSAKASQHIIEFVADGKVFATVGLDKASALSWNLTEGVGVHFSSGFVGITGDRRFFHVSVPKLDYYEYLEVSGTDVKVIPRSDESYPGLKRAFLKITETGYIHELDAPEP